MFHFPRLPPPGLCVQPGVMAHYRHRVAPFGNPGISLLDGSSWLIAVIPRPSSARSAKASTVRRSHLTCATPRACTCREGKFLAGMVAHADVSHRMQRVALFSSPRHSGNSAVIFACHLEPHTYLPRSSGCSKQPADARVSRSPPDVGGIRRRRRFPGGMLWTHLNHYVPCKGASRRRSPPALGGLLKVGCKNQYYPRRGADVNKRFTEAVGRRWTASVRSIGHFGRLRQALDFKRVQLCLGELR